MHEYILKRSLRKSLSLQIKNGILIVKSPLFVSKIRIDEFLQKHRDWIDKKLEQSKNIDTLSQEDILNFKKKAKSYIPVRVQELALRFGYVYNNIRITSAQTRWGSCSSKKNLNFSYRLMAFPSDVIDYVIVHELAHLKHMNHSQKFWHEVALMMPDYKEKEKVLKGKVRNI